METLPTDSSGANPSSVKSEDSSPQADNGRGSPPPNCAICLGTCKNKSFTDSCLHQFCFNCLLTWSKVKAECPLCKQNFKSIIHNVRSNHQYEEYLVEQRHVEENLDIDSNSIEHVQRRFRYRTTLTLPRRSSVAIEQLLLQYPLVVPVSRAPLPPRRRRRSPVSFRRTVYRHNLWARPLPDFTGRFRDATPDFYRYNQAQMHRLVPWLNRELHYLLNENIPHISYVLNRILELLPRYHINSTEFREALHYFGDRTEHFLHELYCFASTPYDMTGYDRNVQYTTDPRISTMVNEVISSSESEGSADSDIVVVTGAEPAGPSAAAPTPTLQPTRRESGYVIPIETISHSDTDDESEVMVVGYIKPPQERTPEVVDLLGSDSDVVVQDNPTPGPSNASELHELNAAPLVKVSIKRHTDRSDDSETESEAEASRPRPPPPKRRRRTRSAGSATTADTRRCTSSAGSGDASDHSDASWHITLATTADQLDTGSSTSGSSSTDRSGSSDSDSSSSETSSSSSSTESTSTSESSSSHSARRRRARRKKSRRKKLTQVPIKDGVLITRRKDLRKMKKRATKERTKRNQATQTKGKAKVKEEKTHSGKNPKPVKKSEERTAGRAADPSQPSTSGTQAAAARGREPLQEADGRRRVPNRERNSSRDSRRLKSVVKVMNKPKSETRAASNLLDIVENAILDPNSNVLACNSDNSMPSDDRSRSSTVPSELLERAESCFKVEQTPRKESKKETDNSDSEDDLPLNLTINKSQ